MRSTAKLRNVRLFLLTLSLLASTTGVRGLRNVTIKIPLAVAPGSTVNMNCQYDLESETLYTVKWYKGRNEFFRYVPKELPHTRVFPLPGINVDTNQSDSHHVVLNDVQPDLQGRYRCEVSADSPTFHTEMVSSYMHVAYLPQGNPKIEVEKLRYAVGEVVKGNCSAPPGKPAANVTWTVNGIPVNASTVLHPTVKTGDAQEATIAGLDFDIAPDSFKNGRLHIICQVNVFSLYDAQTEIFLEEERPRLASVLGNAARRTGEWLYMLAAGCLLFCTLR